MNILDVATGCLTCAGLILAVFAICFLGATWEKRKRRLKEEMRPAEERIADIRKDASFEIRELQKVLDRFKDEQPQLCVWIPPTIEYYRRLDELASRADATPEEIDRFADEATAFVRERRLKGVGVGLLARRLADIAHRGNAA